MTPNTEKGFLIVSTIMGWLIIFAIIIALLPSCSPRIQYIPLETKITDTVSITDTLIVRELQQHNDTVVVEATGGTASSFLSNPYCYTWATFALPLATYMALRQVQLHFSTGNTHHHKRSG